MELYWKNSIWRTFPTKVLYDTKLYLDILVIAYIGTHEIIILSDYLSDYMSDYMSDYIVERLFLRKYASNLYV